MKVKKTDNFDININTELQNQDTNQDNTKVIFSYANYDYSSRNEQIYSINLDGTGFKKLTTGDNNYLNDTINYPQETGFALSSNKNKTKNRGIAGFIEYKKRLKERMKKKFKK